MEITTAHQGVAFFMSVIVGVLIGFIFDIFKLFRKGYDVNKKGTIVADILFAAIVLYLIFSSFLSINNGILRLYEFIALAIGALLYRFFLAKLLVFVLILIIKFFYKLSRIILFPAIVILRFFRPIFARAKGQIGRDATRLKRFAKRI
ncbi:spore cortex biosynthesis protein YabQ [Treponema sp. R6D11]